MTNSSNPMGSSFKSTIERYCAHFNWQVAEATEEYAKLQFTMESQRRQTVYILRYESTLEFDVPSMAAFDSEEQIPHQLSTILLKRSAQRKVGFWCIEEIGGKHVYSYMHNVELRLLDLDYFGMVVRSLITEVDDFEGILLKMLNDD